MKKTLSLLLALVMLFSLGISAFAADAPAEETDALVVDTMILMEADDNMINNYTLLACSGCRRALISARTILLLSLRVRCSQ